MPECGWHLYRVYDAGLSGQVHALHESAAWIAALLERGDDLWACDSCAEAIHADVLEQRTSVEASRMKRYKKNGEE